MPGSCQRLLLAHFLPVWQKVVSVLERALFLFTKKGLDLTLATIDPISLLSVMVKVFEKLVSSVMRQHLNEHQRFGFRPGRSTSDLPLLLSQEWQDTLDESLDTLVVALDIAGLSIECGTQALWLSSNPKVSTPISWCYSKINSKEGRFG